MPATTKAAPTRTKAAELRDSGSSASSVGRSTVSAHTWCKQCSCLAGERVRESMTASSAAGEFGVVGRIK